MPKNYRNQIVPYVTQKFTSSLDQLIRVNTGYEAGVEFLSGERAPNRTGGP